MKRRVLLTAAVLLFLWAGLNVWSKVSLSVNGDMIPVVILLSAAPVYWLFRRSPRKPGFCPNCGYDLRASNERCPECGTPVPVKSGK